MEADPAPAGPWSCQAVALQELSEGAAHPCTGKGDLPVVSAWDGLGFRSRKKKVKVLLTLGLKPS